MKNNFKQAKELFDKRYNDELNKVGIFWAFSKEQFEENKTHKESLTDDFIPIGGGGYIHKSNKEKLNKFFNVIAPKLEEEFSNSVNMDDLIEYELVNHECYYTGEWQSIINIIKDYYPNINVEKEIKRVYDKTKEQKWELMGL